MTLQERQHPTAAQAEAAGDNIPLMATPTEEREEDWKVLPTTQNLKSPRRGRCGRSCLLLFFGALVGFLFAKLTTNPTVIKVLDKSVLAKLPTLSHLRTSSKLPSPIADRVVLTMRTGSSVLYERLPPHLEVFERERDLKPNVLIYSDWEWDVGEWKVKDVLANVSDKIRGQKDFKKAYGELKSVVEDNGRIDAFKEGHLLDKYKFMPLWDDAFRTYPDADWYIGTEDDAFIFWKPLLAFLSTLDSSVQYYIGCANILVRTNSLFANGGCTYIFSHSILAATFGASRTFVDSMDDELDVSCCGDGELGAALWKSPNVTIKDVSEEGGRRFSGASPWDHLYDQGVWCEELLTLHHLDAWALKKLYRFADVLEKKLPSNDTVRYVDVHDHFLPTFLHTNASTATHTAWIALDTHISPRISLPLPSNTTAWTSLTCSQACLDESDCFVWTYFPPHSDHVPADYKVKGECWILKNATTFGQRVQDDREKEMTSGWMLQRIKEWRGRFWCSQGRYEIEDDEWNT